MDTTEPVGDQENRELNRTTKPSGDSTRQPLRQLSARSSAENASNRPAGSPKAPAATRAIPQSSVSEVAEPRDWIYPVPPNKPETENIDWDTRKSEMMKDLSYCVDIDCTDETIDFGESDEDLGDISDILGLEAMGASEGNGESTVTLGAGKG